MNYDEAIAEINKCIEEVKPKCFSNSGFSGEERDAAVKRVSTLSGVIGRLGFERDREDLLKDRYILPPPIKVIITLDNEEAENLAKTIPGSIVVQKMRKSLLDGR